MMALLESDDICSRAEKFMGLNYEDLKILWRNKEFLPKKFEKILPSVVESIFNDRIS